MKLTIFQSDKGDCLLLEARSGELVLCDGGMGPSLRDHVRAELGALREAGRALEFIYISHIDNDHISGVLQLLEDEVAWRVFDHHQQRGRPVRPPRVPRPPVIKGLLHNGFRDLITVNNRRVEDLLAARAIEQLVTALAPPLFATAVPELMAAADELQAIATGVPEALRVSRLAAAEALDIPLNAPPGVTTPARLLFAGQPGEVFDLGALRFTLIGPTRKEIHQLRDGWNNWLRENKDKLKKLRAELKQRVEAFSTGALTDSPFDLAGWEGLDNYKGVTVPNIASLMWLVEEDGKRLLLTGDSQQDFILAGLARRGLLADGAVHLDVLKVQHHGSRNNLDAAFAQQVSADHYVFCGNGEHSNPDLEVLDLIYNSRLGKPAVRSRAPEAEGRPFHFWFSTTAAAQDPSTKKHAYFKTVEQRVGELVERSNGQLRAHFNAGASIVLAV